jgi:hypothetical protein
VLAQLQLAAVQHIEYSGQSLGLDKIAEIKNSEIMTHEYNRVISQQVKEAIRVLEWCEQINMEEATPRVIPIVA